MTAVNKVPATLTGDTDGVVGRRASASNFARGISLRRASFVPIAIGLWLVAYLSWTAFHWWGDPVVVSDAAPIPLAIAATVLAWLASRAVTVPSGTRRAWRFVAAACAAWTAGECTWFYFEVVRHSQPFPSLADAFYLAFYPLMFVGLTMLPVRRARRGERLTLGLDAAAVTIASLMAIWYLVVTPTVQSSEGSLLAEVLSLAYPVGDLVLVLGAARLLMRHRGPHLKVPLWCLVGGVLAFALADVAYAQLSLSDTYVAGTLPDALWIVGLSGLALAGWIQWRYGNPTSEAHDEVDAEMPVSNLPYFAVAGGLGLVLYEATLDAGGSLIALVAGALALTGVVVWRQRVVMRENERLVAELHRTANTDALTGLLSRRRFLELAERVVDRSGSASDPVAVLMIDIDHFKMINDSIGHAGGDDAICEVAARCESALRPGDLLGRLGGDELVAILPGITADDTDRIATRLTHAVADAPVLTGRGLISVTISIGASVAVAPVALDQLLSDADTALYAAKAAGRNQHLTHPRASPREQTSPPVAELAAPRR